MRLHPCPGCRVVDVPNTLLCCRACWYEIPYAVREKVRSAGEFAARYRIVVEYFKSKRVMAKTEPQLF